MAYINLISNLLNYRFQEGSVFGLNALGPLFNYRVVNELVSEDLCGGSRPALMK